MAGLGKYKKGAKFTLKSGNNPSFKDMGSSPIEQDTEANVVEPTQTKLIDYESMKDIGKMTATGTKTTGQMLMEGLSKAEFGKKKKKKKKEEKEEVKEEVKETDVVDEAEEPEDDVTETQETEEEEEGTGGDEEEKDEV